VDYHFMREKVLNGNILIKFTSTLDRVADIFTKGLSTTRFSFLKSKLMVTTLPLSLWGDASVKLSTADNTTTGALEDTASATAALSRKDHQIMGNHLPLCQPRIMGQL
jgi:hypothetical protein